MPVFSLRPRVFFGLIALLWVAVFFVCVWNDQAVPPLFRLSTPALVRAGALALPLHSPLGLVRLAFSWLVHVDSIHFLSNLLALSCVAHAWPQTDRVVGPLGLGVAVSGAASILVHRGAATICCGGSGVLLALLPTAVVSAPSRLRAAICLIAGVLLFGSGFFPAGDWAAHVGGLAAGILWLVRHRATG